MPIMAWAQASPARPALGVYGYACIGIGCRRISLRLCIRNGTSDGCRLHAAAGLYAAATTGLCPSTTTMLLPDGAARFLFQLLVLWLSQRPVRSLSELRRLSAVPGSAALCGSDLLPAAAALSCAALSRVSAAIQQLRSRLCAASWRRRWCRPGRGWRRSYNARRVSQLTAALLEKPRPLDLPLRFQTVST